MNCSEKLENWNSSDNSESEPSSRQKVLTNIEKVILDLVKCMATTDALKLTYPTKDKKSNKIFASVVQFGSKLQRPHFTLLLHIMEKIFDLIILKHTCTVRDLYYGYVKFYREQRKLETILGEICFIAKVGRFDLPIHASAKGLIVGDLSWTGDSGIRMCLEELNSKGVLITTMFLEAQYLKSNAKFILFVEKDAVFQTLLQGWIQKIDAGNFLMMTGKGYADRLTRRVLNHLSTTLKIPAFALVDADPFGLDILANIKWGPTMHDCLKMHNYSCEGLKFQEETLPNIYWVGLRPSEIGKYAQIKEILPLTATDEKKFCCLKQRAITNGEDLWIQEIECSLNENVKAEIEALGSYLPQYIKQRITNYIGEEKENPEMELAHDSQNIHCMDEMDVSVAS